MKLCKKCGLPKKSNEFRTKLLHRDGLSNECFECEKTRKRAQKQQKPHAKLDKKLLYETTIGTDDEIYAYEAFLRLRCETDEDFDLPENSLECFRERVKEWVSTRRRKIYTV